MSNKLKLSQASMIVTLGIILSLITIYIPIFSILGLAISVPYAIIATMTDNKFSFLSLIITFFVLIFIVNPAYSVSVCITSVLPGLVIGSATRINIKQGQVNKFEPIYVGIIIVVICTIIFYLISNFIFNTNLLDDFMNLMKDTLKTQLKVLNDAGIDINSIKPDDVVNFVYNLLPVILFIQGIVLSFITYYLEVFILRRIRVIKIQIPKFTNFYLPGKPVIASLVLYMLILFMDILGVKLHNDLIMMNLQLVFSIMFLIQGVSVCIYYLKNWFKSNQLKKIFMYIFGLYLFGFMGISLVGMLDSVIDFRKVKCYKSI